MDIDEFLERELYDLGLPAGQYDKPEAGAGQAQADNDINSSPLFDSIRLSIAKGDLDIAEKSYFQLWRTLLQQRLKWNKELYEQLASLSRQLSGALQMAHDEVRRKAEHIYGLITRGRASLKEGKKEAPLKIYAEIEETINSIPDVFFEEKKIVEEQAIDFYKELTSATDNELVNRVSRLFQESYTLADSASAAIRSGDMISAIASYNKCIETYLQIPEGFLRHKNPIGMRILEIYKSLSIYTEITALQKQLENSAGQHKPQKSQQPNPNAPAANTDSRQKHILLHSRKERAKRSMEKGLYSEASREIEEALKIKPDDAETMAIHAKLKAMQ